MKSTLKTAISLVNTYKNDPSATQLVTNAKRIIKESGDRVLMLANSTSESGGNFNSRSVGNMFAVVRETKCYLFIYERFIREDGRIYDCERKINKDTLCTPESHKYSMRFIEV